MPAANNMSVFTTQIKNNQDLAKSWLFQVFFETDNPSLAKLLDKDNLVLRAKSASIPSKTFGELTTEYLGTKLFYPGKATVDGDLTIKFDEFQDLSVSTTFHKWQQLLMNTGIENDIAAPGIVGGASSNYLKDYTATIRVVLWDSAKTAQLPVEWRFYFCYPKEVQNTELAMDSDAKIERTVVFKYSTFECVATA